MYTLLYTERHIHTQRYVHSNAFVCVRVCASSKWECTFLLCSWIFFFHSVKKWSFYWHLEFIIKIQYYYYLKLFSCCRQFKELFLCNLLHSFSLYFLSENKCCSFFLNCPLQKTNCFLTDWLTAFPIILSLGATINLVICQQPGKKKAPIFCFLLQTDFLPH